MQHQETRVQDRGLYLIQKLIKGVFVMANKKATPKDYDRWDGKVGIKVTSKPKKKVKKGK